MNAEQHVPPFRFKGFSDFWEQRKLSDLAMFNPRLELPDSFQYVDLESVSGTELINHRTETKSSAPSRAQRLAKKGDIFYQTVRPYQKNNYLYEKSDDDYVFSTGYAQLRPYEDGYFLFSRLQENGFVSTVLDHSTGTSYPAINSNDLAKLEIMVPLNLNEQQAIGKLFRHIDNAIALHQHKLAKLKELKKGYLQKLFPQNGETVPEFRFKGYSDAWEKRKLGETNSYFTDGNYGESYPKESELSDKENGVPFLRGSNLRNGELIEDNANYITKEKHAELTSGHLVEDDIVLAVRGSLGALGYVKEENIDWNINSQLAVIRTDKSELSGKFLAQFLLSWRGQKELLSRNTGTALKQLPIKQLKDVPVPIVNLDEQKEISALFTSIDNLIAATQCKLDLLKKLKKGYLQKMFC